MGCRLPGWPMPSTVRTSAPSGIRFIFVMQASVYLPLTSTAQEPQWPSSQPSLVPVSSNCLRRTSMRVVSGYTTTDCGRPLTTRLSFCILASQCRTMCGKCGNGHNWIQAHPKPHIRAATGAPVWSNGLVNQGPMTYELKSTGLVSGIMFKISQAVRYRQYKPNWKGVSNDLIHLIRFI